MFFSVISDLGSCISFLQTLSGFSTKPTKSKITLEISPDFKIACDIWKKCMTENIPTLKKQSNESYDPTDSNSGAVKIDRVYRTTDEEELEVPFEERIKGYKYGPQYIPVSAADESSLKLSSEEAVIRALGFVPARRVARHHFLESANIVEGSTDSSARVISTFAVAMAKSSQLLVARYVKKKDSDVVLAILMPSPADDGTLILHRIPCTEDFRNFPFPHMTPVDQISASQKIVMSNFVDSLTRPFDISSSSLLTYNAPYLSVLQEAQRRALNLPATETDIPITSPFALAIPDAANDSIKTLFSAFPLEVVELKSTKKRKMYWADIEIITEEPGFEASDEAMSTIEPSASQVAGVVSDHQAEGAVIELSSLNPSEDFERLIKIIPTSDFGKLFSKMTEVIEQLVTQGGSNAHFRKSVAALKVFRKSSIDTKNANVYNGFLKSTIKPFSTGRFVTFWGNFFVPEGITLSLITASECPSSAISNSDAADFLLVKNETALKASSTVVTEDDDMFMNME
jgi:ATP-dependent DNA helicase 2 subunit 2